MQEAFNGMEAAERELVTQAEFARRIRRSKAAVTGYIKDGKLSGEAIVETSEGRRIDVTEATRQLAVRLDPVQRVAQPTVQPSAGAPAAAGNNAAAPVEQDEHALRLRRSKAELSEVQAARARAELMERNGEWLRGDEVTAAWTRGVGELLGQIEAGFEDMADALLKVPQGNRKAMIVALRQAFRGVRGKIAQQLRLDAEEEDATKPAEELAA